MTTFPPLMAPASAPVQAAQRLLAGRSSATVLAAMSPQLPHDLVTALVQVARARDVELTLLIADLTGAWAFLDPVALDDAVNGRLRLIALAGGVPAFLSGVVDYLPQSLWEVDRLIQSGDLAFDVFVARMSTTSRPGELSYGSMIGFSASALDTSAVAGFEVGPGGVEHHGAGGVSSKRADVVVPVEASKPMVTRAEQTSAQSTMIARLVAPLIPDGSTLQIGLGAVPLAVIPELAGKSHLGLHSGILPGALQPLLAEGAITGARKTRDAGLHTATGLLGGTPELWGPDVLLRPVSETHDPRYLLDLEALWAVNSAFEIDLDGQVNAEYVAGRRVASGGGQGDFVRAAHASPGGASVLVLPSRSRSGHSRIVGRLAPGHVVTTSGNDIDFVVTEHGVARLQGATGKERAARLIAVAHPLDRPTLRDGRVGQT